MISSFERRSLINKYFKITLYVFLYISALRQYNFNDYVIINIIIVFLIGQVPISLNFCNTVFNPIINLIIFYISIQKFYECMFL